MDNMTRYKILYKLQTYNDQNKYRTNLIYRSSFELLIAVLLSAQTRDNQVNKVTKKLFKVANTPHSMLILGLDNIKNYIQSIGLFNVKAKNIIKTCQLLIKEYNGVLPNNRLALESLPGVGRKTANVILNLIFHYPTIAVDTHVFRFCNRSQFATGHNVLIVEKKLISVVPKEFKKNCHQNFVNYARHVCQAKMPRCHNCIILNLCEYDQKYKFL